MKRLISILLICLLCLTGCAEQEASTDASPLIPELTAVDINGNRYDNSLFEGRKITMLNLWATYCGPCIGEMPDLGRLNEEYADRGFQVVGIVLDYTSELDIPNIESIIDETGADYIHLLPDASMSELLSTTFSVPTTYFLNENGEPLGEEYIGSRPKEDWAAIIDHLLEDIK